jgi:hypothetical protein
MPPPPPSSHHSRCHHLAVRGRDAAYHDAAPRLQRLLLLDQVRSHGPDGLPARVRGQRGARLVWTLVRHVWRREGPHQQADGRRQAHEWLSLQQQGGRQEEKVNGRKEGRRRKAMQNGKRKRRRMGMGACESMCRRIRERAQKSNSFSNCNIKRYMSTNNHGI